MAGYIEPPHFSKFSLTDQRHGILLTGAPDAVFVCGDGSYMIGDYKTAKFTKGQDALLPTYQIQLNSYARIAAASGYSPVSALTLIYLEPQTDAEAGTAGGCRNYGFDIAFAAHLLPIDLDPGMIDPLLARVRELADLPSAPPGRLGCKDCSRVAGLLSLAGAGREVTAGA